MYDNGPDAAAELGLGRVGFRPAGPPPPKSWSTSCAGPIAKVVGR